MAFVRKYVLWIAFGGLLLFYGGDWLLGVAVRGPMERAQAKNEQLKKRRDGRKAELRAIREEKEQLAVWEAQSLPSDPRLARSLYQAWLVQLVEHVGLAKPSVDSGDPVNRKDLYQMFSFTVRGQGTLDQATRLLFEFYRAGHLHQIRSLELSPSQQGTQFGISLVIEALALPDIKRRDELGSADGDRLASKQLADYQIIAKRNVFGGGGDPDVLSYTRLTAVTFVEGRPQAWFSVDLDDGKTLQKSAGETIEIGTFRAVILEIDGEDVILEIDGQRRLLTIGEPLAEAAALPPEM
jgi:hypothetical protein